MLFSNESSANESNIGGESVNHQYSKSFEFERDFDEFRRRNFPQSAVYFSPLRPFCELQMAKQFSQYKQYHPIFRSCNRGSKKTSGAANARVPVRCDNAPRRFCRPMS